MDSINVYAGAFSVFLSMIDAKINFMAVEPDINETGAIVGEKTSSVANVTLSLPLAKQLAQNLTAAIQKYESDISPILTLNDKGHNSLDSGV